MLAGRRKLLTRLVAAFSLVSVAGFSFPFIKSWLPGRRGEIFFDVDIEQMKIGEALIVRWLGRNVYIVNRDANTEETLHLSNKTREDPFSLHSNQPTSVTNTHRSLKIEHLVVYTNCTHLGCEVALRKSELAHNGVNKTDAGFDCPCHSSEFDIAGRVAKGSAAKRNLEVPNYRYIAKNVIRLIKV
jgi:ubiquinol-cytochrome c reductase iron-sulfur subunit